MCQRKKKHTRTVGEDWAVSCHTTRREIEQYIATYKARSRVRREEETKNVQLEPSEFVNRVTCGDCFDLIPLLPDRSISAVITSPPYADQRSDYYPGISEDEYPEWFCSLMDVILPKLADDGSVLVVISSFIQQGEISNYVLRTRLKVQERGWKEPEELIWYKPDGPPLGSIKTPRRAFEQILWFAKCDHNPLVNLTAGGRETRKKGFQDRDPHNLYGTSATLEEGVARITNVFTFGVNEVDKGIDHPAIFPPTLATSLIQTFSRPEGVVLDPFLGSGTTALAAQKIGRDFVAFEIVKKYADLAASRLSSTRKQE